METLSWSQTNLFFYLIQHLLFCIIFFSRNNMYVCKYVYVWMYIVNMVQDDIIIFRNRDFRRFLVIKFLVIFHRKRHKNISFLFTFLLPFFWPKKYFFDWSDDFSNLSLRVIFFPSLSVCCIVCPNLHWVEEAEWIIISQEKINYLTDSTKKRERRIKRGFVLKKWYLN